MVTSVMPADRIVTLNGRDFHYLDRGNEGAQPRGSSFAVTQATATRGMRLRAH